MNEYITFFIGYSLLGVLPLLQLRFLWTFLQPDQIGRVLAVSTIAVVIAAFCDGALSYGQSHGAANTQQGRETFLRVWKVRFARLLLVSPVACIGYNLAGKPIELPLSIGFLAASYCLNFSFVDRLAGSVRDTLRDDTACRIHCQFLPAIFSLVEPHHGVLVGCVLSLTIQYSLAKSKFSLKVSEFLPNFRGTFSADMGAGVLGLVQASFCQVAASLTLSAQQFALFGSLDRLIRASLLASEPARLMALRKSRMNPERLTQLSMLWLSIAVAGAACLVVGAAFQLHLEQILFSIRLPFMPYIFVSACITFVSVSTLCIFIRVGSFWKLNALLVIAVIAGCVSYMATFKGGPFHASLAFEVTAFTVVAIGAVLESLRETKGIFRMG